MKLKKVLFSVVLIFAFLILLSSVSNAANDTIPFDITVYQDYNASYEVLDIVNEERKAVGKSALTMDKDLLECAMIRASEIVFRCEATHTRPNGESCFTIVDKYVGAMGENIAAGQVTPQSVMVAWMNSEGHKNNILDAHNFGFTTIGVGAVKYDGAMYWVQIFGGKNLSVASKLSNDNKTRKIDVLSENVKLEYDAKTTIIKSESIDGILTKTKVITTGTFSKLSTIGDASEFIYESSDKSVFIVDNDGIIKPVSNGTAELTIKLKQNNSIYVKQKIKITEDVNNLKISNISDKTYTGDNIKPDVTIKDGDYKLVKDKDYELEYSNNKNCGKATVKIKGIGKYTGTIEKKFKIVPQKVTGLKQSEATENSVKISWKKQKGVTGYKVYLYNSKTDKYEHYTTTKNTSVKIKNLESLTKYKIKVKAYKTTDGVQYKGSYSSALKVTTAPKKVTNVKVKSKSKNSIKLSWQKISGVTGYKVYVYNTKTKKYEYYGKTKSTSITINKLKSGKTYKIKVRAYKSYNGKQYFGKYSSVIKQTTKK